MEQCDATATLAVGILSLIVFAVAEIRARPVFEKIDPRLLPSRLRALDPVEGFSSVKPEGLSLEGHQVEFLCSHSIWHLTSGLTMLLLVLALIHRQKRLTLVVN